MSHQGKRWQMSGCRGMGRQDMTASDGGGLDRMCNVAQPHCGAYSPTARRRRRDMRQIDYRDLLRRYMNHVGNEEGITFVHRIRDRRAVKQFTEEEIEELEAIEEELREGGRQ